MMLVEYEHPGLGTVRSVGLPITVGDYKPEYRRGPRLGEDGITLLAQLGYSEAAIAALSDRGAFGAAHIALDGVAAPD
jgi:crotonobetainyl-CoA:carnitine CoA-transferase CaiB-like acyl-CoA transferase